MACICILKRPLVKRTFNMIAIYKNYNFIRVRITQINLIKSCAFLPSSVFSHFCFNNRHLLYSFNAEHTITYNIHRKYGRKAYSCRAPCSYKTGLGNGKTGRKN